MTHSLERFTSDSPRYSSFRDFATLLYAGDPYWMPPDDPSPAHQPLCFLLSEGDAAVARACVVLNPDINSTKTALVGWYECINDLATARMLLDAVADHCRDNGCTSLIGPMNGSTWHRYRFAEPSDHSPFFLDIHNKPWYAEQWSSCGFETIARYHSTRFDVAPQETEELRSRLADDGVTLRQLRLADFNEELRRLHTLSLAGFNGNYLYSPISFEDFSRMYRRLETLVRPEFVRIAENAAGDAVGFVFAIDNLNERQRRSLVMKSAAVLPEHQGKGLGHLLLATVHQAARVMGNDEIIHALMHTDNRSASILAAQSTHHRSYRLFRKEL